MDQSPSWEAKQFSASLEILHILWNPKVHYSIDKCRTSVPVVSHHDPVHTTLSHFLMIHLNIIVTSMPGSLSLKFLHQNPSYVSLLPHTRHRPRPSNFSWFYHPKNIERGIQIVKSLFCSFLYSLLISTLLGPNILLNILFSNTLSLIPSHNMSEQISHP